MSTGKTHPQERQFAVCASCFLQLCYHDGKCTDKQPEVAKFRCFVQTTAKEFSANCNLTKFNRRVLCQQEKRTRRKGNSPFAQNILFCRWLEQRYCLRFYACFTFYFNCGKIFQHIVIEPFKRQRQRIFLCKSLSVVKSLSTKKRLKTGVFVCYVKLHCNICKVE